MFSLMAGSFRDIASSAAEDPAQAEFARMIARDRAVDAAGRIIVFLFLQAGIQVVALFLSTRIASRGLEAEFARMERTISEQRRRLEEAAALSAWKEVVSFMGHQLKNPLAAVDLAAANAAEAFSRCGADSSPMGTMVTESLTAIREEGGRMKAIIDRLKALTAFSAPSFAPVSLAGLIRGAAERHGPESLVLSISGDAMVYADAELLRQALVNLLNNSVEAAESSGKLPVRVGVDVRSSERGVSLRYTDSCRLEDPSIVADLGRRLRSTKSSGSGLGLLFASRIMAIHGGSLDASVGAAGGLELELSFGATARTPPPGGKETT